MILRGREVLRLEASGPVVGLLKNATYEQAEFDLRPTDVLVGFTDGISEALTVEEEEWGEERLIDAVRESLTCPAAQMIQEILDAADRFTRGAKQFDDMTLVVLKVL
jgi:sigma-B regulation protein RsbU (phosphoserine phosphatase)